MSHPPQSSVSTLSLGWHCQRDDATDDATRVTSDSNTLRMWRYGWFARDDISNPLPSVDHVVRWVRRDWGWGIIGDPEGDLWFHVSDLKGGGFSPIVDGSIVEYAVDDRLDSSTEVLRRVERGSLVLR